MAHNFDIAIIGGGILGTSLSYFLSSLNKSKKIAVIEQAHSVAFHTSGRNTGKVHAPYLYNPEKKKLFAKSAFHGYDMWKEYARLKDLPFKEDGVKFRQIKRESKFLKNISNGEKKTDWKRRTLN